MGLVSLIVTVKTWDPVLPAATGWKPLLMAASDKGTHGLSKLDWVTVWFAGLNQNRILSPIAAVTVSGSKTNREPGPTWTSWVPEGEEAAAELVVDAESPPPYCASAAGKRNEIRYAERMFVGLLSLLTIFWDPFPEKGSFRWENIFL